MKFFLTSFCSDFVQTQVSAFGFDLLNIKFPSIKDFN